jgi:hypothetical protein
MAVTASVVVLAVAMKVTDLVAGVAVIAAGIAVIVADVKWV